MKPKILFVDDELNIIQGIQRTLFTKKKIWDIFFCNSGAEALELMEKVEMDIIVSDMRMPHMNGLELLAEIKFKHPKTIRFILTGQSDDESLLKTSSIAHLILFKPCDDKKLSEAVTKFLTTKEIEISDQFLEEINSMDVLPFMPDIFIQIETELKRENISLQKIAEIISVDPTLVASILHLSNSSLFSQNGSIVNILQAVTLLGVDIIKSFVLYSKLTKTTNLNSQKIEVERLLKHSQLVAKTSRAIVKEFTEDPKKIDMAYLAGLLHDIGKFVLMAHPKYANLKLENSFTAHIQEKELFEASHINIGAYLLKLWQFSDEIVDLVINHHSFDKVKNENSISNSVFIANILQQNYKTEEALLIEIFGEDNINKWKKLIQED